MNTSGPSSELLLINSEIIVLKMFTLLYANLFTLFMPFFGYYFLTMDTLQSGNWLESTRHLVVVSSVLVYGFALYFVGRAMYAN